jgi:predicted deacylase
MGNATRIFTDVNYETDGKQIGWLYLPHSVTRSAYGNLSFPIAVIKNGVGPTVLLMAGVHGDEYEGQIALCKLIRSLDPEQVRGRLIILPAANLPAAMAGARVSPIDQWNLNRAFPGDPNGSPTLAIAHYIDSVLYPMTDFLHDLHSGGSSLDYVPFASMRKSADPALDSRALGALRAFGPSIGLVWGHTLDTGFAATAAVHRGIVALGGEFGGGGTVSLPALQMVERGIRNLLVHAGCMDPIDLASERRNDTRLMEVRSRDYFALAPETGLFEPFVELGDMVEAGQPCGQVHFVDNPGREPVRSHFRATGMVICKRRFGTVERGDCVAHIATEWQG